MHIYKAHIYAFLNNIIFNTVFKPVFLTEHFPYEFLHGYIKILSYYITFHFIVIP